MAAEKKDYYSLLGVDRDVGPDELKKAYRKLAVQFHPDKNPGDIEAEEKFKEITEAYEILRDTDKRRQYDQFGHQAFGSGAGGFGRGGSGIDLEEALRTFMGNFGGAGGSIFDDFFGGRGGGARDGSSRGADLRFDLEIDFEESVFGSEREISYPVLDACTDCGGSGAAKGSQKTVCSRCGGQGVVVSSNGFFHMRQACTACGGSGEVIGTPCAGCRGNGRVKSRRTLTLKIPKGVETGSRLRVREKGEGGTRGGSPGDLYVVLHVKSHDLFKRNDLDIYLEFPVPFHIAALGGEVEVPTIHGPAKLKIPSGTETGKVFRLRGKGVTGIKGYRDGDQQVSLVVQVPTRLSGRQKKVLAEFGETLGESNHDRVKRFGRDVQEFFERKRSIESS